MSGHGLDAGTTGLVSHPHRFEAFGKASLRVLSVSLHGPPRELCSVLNLFFDSVIQIQMNFEVVLRVPVRLLLAPLLELVDLTEGLGTLRVLDLFSVRTLHKHTAFGDFWGQARVSAVTEAKATGCRRRHRLVSHAHRTVKLCALLRIVGCDGAFDDVTGGVAGSQINPVPLNGSFLLSFTLLVDFGAVDSRLDILVTLIQSCLHEVVVSLRIVFSRIEPIGLVAIELGLLPCCLLLLPSSSIVPCRE